MKQDSVKSVCFVTGCLLLGLIVCGLWTHRAVRAEEVKKQEKVYYIVRDGDCLWTISDRFYNDPFLWPFVWQNNSYITNPHWIYPGEQIFLADVPGGGAGADVQERVEQQGTTETGAAMVTIPGSLADNAILSEKEMSNEGWVLESLHGRTLLAQGDEVFLEMSSKETIPNGTVYQIIRSVREVRHPETHKRMGILYHLIGFVKTSEVSSSGIVPARILMSSSGIQAGDLVTKSIQVPKHSFYSKPSARDLRGCIVTGLKNNDVIAQYDVCFIDKGLLDGVEVGDSFWAMDPGKNVPGYGEDRSVRLPDNKIGTLVVLFAEKNSSTVLVTESDLPLGVGTPVKSWTE
jgi:hypothetical protein